MKFCFSKTFPKTLNGNILILLTLVEVGECFLMQFDGRRGSCTQNILKGKDLVVTVWRQAGFLLLEDGQGENIAGDNRDKISELLGGLHNILKIYRHAPNYQHPQCTVHIAETLPELQ